MKQRIISGILFGSIMIIMVFGGQYTFMLLMLLVCFLSLREYHRIHNQNRPGENLFACIGTFLAGVLLWFLFLNQNFINWKTQIISILMALSLAVILYALLRLSGTKTTSSKGMTGLIRGIVYLVPPVVLFTYVGNFAGEYSPKTILFLLLLVWVNDSAAYFVGSQFGRHKLSPNISPNKTWEGFFGGLFFTMIIGLCIASYLTPFSSLDGLYMGGLASIFGPVGDLFESQYKRNVGIKDSGNLIPGHGGALDRFDALFFVVPVCAIYLTYLK